MPGGGYFMNGHLTSTLPTTTRQQKDVNPFTLKLALELQAEAAPVHWREVDSEDFAPTERRLRDLNRNAARIQHGGGDVADDLFLSHCWRQQNTQELARMIISYLSQVRADTQRGFTYWADFLDLAAVGPVPWRQEIHDAVRGTAKFVALIDEAYLNSFNCIQELYCAMWESKPIVPIILDNRAWKILTSPRAAEDMWSSNKEFQDHEGVTLVDDIVFDQHSLREVLGCVANINMCPCRPVDFELMGHDTCLGNTLAYVARDLPYLKEHSKLGNRAHMWSSLGRPLTAAALLVGEDIANWSAWLDQAIKYQQHPLPTDLQKDYIQASKRYASRRLRILAATGAFLVFLIVFAAAAAGYLAVVARRQADVAQREIHDALEDAMISRMLSKEAIVSSTLSALGRDPGVTHLWELKVVKALLAQLSPAHTEDTVYIAKSLAMARSLMSRPVVTSEAPLYGAVDGSVVQALRWSPSGQWLAVGGPTGTLHLFPMDQDGILGDSRTLEGHDHRITAVSWLPTDQKLASASGDGTVRVWSHPYSGDQAPVILHNHTDMVTSVAWSPSGLHLASSCLDGVVRVWNVSATGVIDPHAFHKLRSTSDPVVQLAWSPSGRWLASGGDDGSVSLWAWGAAGAGGPHTVLSLHSEAVTALAWLPQGGLAGNRLDSNGTQLDLLVSSGMDEMALLSSLTAGGEAYGEPLVLEHSNVIIHDLAWTPSGLAAACRDGSVRIWAADVGAAQSSPKFTMSAHTRDASSVSWWPPGDYLASVSFGGLIRVWAMKMGVTEGNMLSGTTSYDGLPLRKVAWSPAGDLLAIGADGGDLYIQPVRTDGSLSESEAALTRLPVPERAALSGMSLASSSPTDLGWSQSGNHLAVSGIGDVMIWNTRRGQPVTEMPTQRLSVDDANVAQWSPTGQHLASTSDDVVRIWTIEDDDSWTGPSWTSEPVADTLGVALEGHTGTITAGKWSPSGHYFATAGEDSAVRVWRMDMLSNSFSSLAVQVLYTNHTAGAPSVLGWSPNGSQLATGGCDNKVRVWSVLQDGAISTLGAQELSGPMGCISSLAWSRSGGHLAAGVADNSVFVWAVNSDGYVLRDLAAVQVLRRSSQGSHSVSSGLAWSPNGQLVSVGPAGGLKVWGAFTVDEVLKLFESAGAYRNVDWTISVQEELIANGIVPSMLTLPKSRAPDIPSGKVL